MKARPFIGDNEKPPITQVVALSGGVNLKSTRPKGLQVGDYMLADD